MPLRLSEKRVWRRGCLGIYLNTDKMYKGCEETIRHTLDDTPYSEQDMLDEETFYRGKLILGHQGWRRGHGWIERCEEYLFDLLRRLRMSTKMCLDSGSNWKNRRVLLSMSGIYAGSFRCRRPLLRRWGDKSMCSL